MRIARTLILSLSLLLTLPVVAFAYWDWNILAGVSAGTASRSGHLQTEMDYTNTAVGSPGYYATTVKHKINDSGFIWGLLGGAQATCGPYAFGIEASYRWHDFDDDVFFAFSDAYNLQGWNGRARFEQGNVFALSLRAGYKLLDWLMAYARIGAETSKDKLRVIYSGNETYPFSFAAHDSKNNIRYLGGLGIEVPFPLIPNLVARLEYNYHTKGNTIEAEGLFADSPAFISNARFVAETKQDMHSALASIVLNFG